MLCTGVVYNINATGLKRMLVACLLAPWMTERKGHAVIFSHETAALMQLANS